ncbi:MAG: NTP transferase domain-containing protein [Rhodospirillaceae bacterium]|nr:NTP transferase domain-containing protein [Rhodospirillaceae bacterium]MBT5567160.1 NTP transferase domain-containing protein [Rhodospirillaceae bacterium]MBT6089373.1 NTP transferase domain-containing protein [Rhodospirillaceae bacterium]MBT6960233.1 NTP transferase domain-containing protein [Rhodospirillaceae bacterium]
MKAVILAAGQGTRMRAVGPSKPMVSVEGTALLERVITNALNGGVTDFVVVTGYNGQPIQEYVKNLAGKLPCTITCADNGDWHLGNGRSVLAAKPYVDGPFHVLMADHLFDPEILNIVRKEPLPDHGARLAVDLRLQNPHVDIDDVTKVHTKGDKIVDIGKGITGFNAFDTGVFWCTPGLFTAIEDSIESAGDDSLSGGVRILAAAELMGCCDIGDRTWIDVDTPALLTLAQEAMVERATVAV